LGNAVGAEQAIETHGLAKTYRSGVNEVEAVRGLNLTVAHGEIYALLGPNGAGKTTTLAMLTTLLLPTTGIARVAGFDVVQQPEQVRRRIGVTFQELVLDQDLTGRQVLDFHAQLYGMDRNRRRARIDELAALVELQDVLDRKSSRYSGGMKRRLELARGLMTAPQVLFLDEPTQGLDPQNRAGIWRYIRELREQQGISLLLTTHSMEEAETLADRVGIMDSGTLIVEGAPGQLVQQMGADVISLRGSGTTSPFLQALPQLPFVQQVHHVAMDDTESLLQIGVDSGDKRLSDVVVLAAAEGFHVHEVSVARPSLGDVFLSLTGHSLRDRLEDGA
jgi:ABC-2 type transport system ATP-binding protein